MAEVITRDTSSGRLHKRIRTEHGLVPYGGESDNLDDAGAYTVLTAAEADLALVNAERWQLCERCFPVGGPEWDSSSGSPDPEDVA